MNMLEDEDFRLDTVKGRSRFYALLLIRLFPDLKDTLNSFEDALKKNPDMEDTLTVLKSYLLPENIETMNLRNKIMFQSLFPITISAQEGQKRLIAAILAVLGIRPSIGPVKALDTIEDEKAFLRGKREKKSKVSVNRFFTKMTEEFFRRLEVEINCTFYSIGDHLSFFSRDFVYLSHKTSEAIIRSENLAENQGPNVDFLQVIESIKSKRKIESKLIIQSTSDETSKQLGLQAGMLALERPIKEHIKHMHLMWWEELLVRKESRPRIGKITTKVINSIGGWLMKEASDPKKKWIFSQQPKVTKLRTSREEFCKNKDEWSRKRGLIEFGKTEADYDQLLTAKEYSFKVDELVGKKIEKQFCKVGNIHTPNPLFFLLHPKITYYPENLNSYNQWTTNEQHVLIPMACFALCCTSDRGIGRFELILKNNGLPAIAPQQFKGECIFGSNMVSYKFMKNPSL